VLENVDNYLDRLHTAVEALPRERLTELGEAARCQRQRTGGGTAVHKFYELRDNLIGQGTQVLIPSDTSKRKTPRPGWTGGYYAFMRRVLASERGGELYGRRQPMIEPVFGQTKHNRGMGRFHRRGRAAVRAEWRLITATHNLLKLHRHALAAT
jgi:hypothetical protein